MDANDLPVNDLPVNDLPVNDLPVINQLDPGAVRSAITASGAAIIRHRGATLEHFTSLSDALMVPSVHHATNTIERDPLAGDPTTSTVNKGMDAIPLHREGSYAPSCPDLLMLYCVRPARSGGETVLCDGVELLRRLDEGTRRFVEHLDLHWSWVAEPARWKQALGVATVAAAEQALAAVATTLRPYEALDARFDGEELRARFRTRAVLPGRGPAAPSFCNSLMIHAYRANSAYYAGDRFRVTLADGSPFPAEMLDRIRQVAERISVPLAWEPNEMVVFDNARYLHGRRPFDDPRRRILIRMGAERWSA